jgi:hypothetical protein
MSDAIKLLVLDTWKKRSSSDRTLLAFCTITAMCQQQYEQQYEQQYKQQYEQQYKQQYEQQYEQQYKQQYKQQ